MSKSTFPSRYSPKKFVSASQYITELICEKKARKDNKDLPVQFWQLEEWEKFYKQQIWSAAALLKNYAATAIIKALNAKEAYGIYSLRAPHLLPLIKKEQATLDAQASQPVQKVERVDVFSKPRAAKPKKGILDILDE